MSQIIPEFNPSIPPPALPLKTMIEQTSPPHALPLKTLTEQPSPPQTVPLNAVMEQTSPPPALTVNTEKMVQQPTAFPEKLLWKLVKGKTVLQYHLCYGCQNRLFNSKDKIVRNGDGVIIKIELCDNCVKENCDATDLLSNKKRKIVKKT
uniref:Uncharacterized protein n=1 Tax=Meloidogyne enterolobii TaxID=390850 RepID=A0A6V7XLH5_MELEN|nr:unnamed protein product [Meloidogyne enterolobii]